MRDAATADVSPAVTPRTGARGSRTTGGFGRWRPLAVRCVAHVAVWVPFAYACARAIHDGWRPVSDIAVIALRSWDVLTGHGLLVGEATRLGHGIYDPGPLQFWLLTVPVHLDPLHGVLWGAALWCVVAASLAIEAAWAVAGEAGGVIATGVILGVIGWVPRIAMLPAWNPWFGMMFLLATISAAWAVLSGRRAWWPVLAVAASVAAQTHLMFAMPAAGLAMAGLVAVAVDSVRTGRYRAAVVGVILGLACWTAPLIQQAIAPDGNLAQIVAASRRSGAEAGLRFGLSALSAATQPPAYWWLPDLLPWKLGVIGLRSPWFGIGMVVAMALALVVAARVLRSGRCAALVTVGLVLSVTAAETFAGTPAANLWHEQTDLSYLMAPLFPVGVIAWLAIASVVLLTARRVISQGSGTGREGIWGRSATVWVTGLASVVFLATLMARASGQIGGAVSYQRAGRRAVATAAATIGRRMHPGRIRLVVIPQGISSRQVTMGLAYQLRTAGFTAEISTWAFQIGPAYRPGAGRAVRVTVAAGRHGKTHVTIAGSSP